MKSIMVDQNPIAVIEGTKYNFGHKWKGATEVTDPITYVYQKGEEITDEVFISGDTESVSGITQQIREITFLPDSGGKTYICLIQAKVDGNTERRKLIFDIAKPDKEVL